MRQAAQIELKVGVFPPHPLKHGNTTPCPLQTSFLSSGKWSAPEPQQRGGLELGPLLLRPCHWGAGALSSIRTVSLVLFQAHKPILACAAAMTGCLITGGTGGTAMPTGLKNEAHPLERIITRPARGTGGVPEAGSSTAPGSISTTAGSAGPGLVAVPPR